MTPDQVEYAQRVSIVALAGGILGTLIGQAASEKPTIGKSMLGTVLGAAVTGAGYGIYLRSGGTAPGEALTGIGRLRRGPGAHRRLAARPPRYADSRGMRRPGVYQPKFSGLGRTAELKPGGCYQI